jgi:hypothetical protein
MVNHISPLKLAREWGIRLSGTGRKVRLALSMFGLIVGAGLVAADAAASFWPLALLTNLSGDYAGIATLAVGAAFGWALPTIAGFVMVFIAHLTGLAIGLTAIVAGLALAYSIVAAAVGWPSLSSLGVG